MSRTIMKSVSSKKSMSCSFCKENHIGFEFVEGKRIIKCPTLLNTICSYCKEKGHTPKNCMEKQKDDAQLKRREKEWKKEEERERRTKEEEKKKVKKENQKSKYSLLYDSSEEEEEVKKEETPKIKTYADLLKSEPAKIENSPPVEKEEEDKCILKREIKSPRRLRENKLDKEEIRKKRQEAMEEAKRKGIKCSEWYLMMVYDSDSDSD